MAGQHFPKRKLALLCLASVIPREVEESLELIQRASSKQLEMSRLRST